MAKQTIQMPAGASNVTSTGISWSINSSRTLVVPELRAGAAIYLAVLQCLASTGGIILSFASSAGGTDTSNQDLSALWEMQGSATITTSEGEVQVFLNNADVTDAYIWTPSNAAAVMAFHAAHTAGTQYAGMLTLNDHDIPTMKYNGVEISDWKYNGVDISAAKYNGVELL